MNRVHLASALARVDDRILLVASTYPSHAQPLWNFPGGRQQHGELLWQTVVREVREETGLAARVQQLAYISESYDGDTHFLNAVFHVEVEGEIALPEDDHVVDVRWVAVDDVPEFIAVAVVREPLVAYLRGELRERYAARADAGVSVRWPS